MIEISPLWGALAIGEPCPNCKLPVQRHRNAFHWRGVVKDGAWCRDCNAVWAIRGEEIEPLKPRPGPT